jgi:hypothetical protein
MQTHQKVIKSNYFTISFRLNFVTKQIFKVEQITPRRTLNHLIFLVNPVNSNKKQ